TGPGRRTRRTRRCRPDCLRTGAARSGGRRVARDLPGEAIAIRSALAAVRLVSGRHGKRIVRASRGARRAAGRRHHPAVPPRRTPRDPAERLCEVGGRGYHGCKATRLRGYKALPPRLVAL